MSEVRQLGKLIGEDGQEYPFFANDDRACEAGNGCMHYDAGHDDLCVIAPLLRESGIQCNGTGTPSFYQERPAEPTQAELVAQWLEAGEYVVYRDSIDFDALKIGNKVTIAGGGFVTHSMLWSNEWELLHHGDALSTIEFLCGQGYHVEFEEAGGTRRAVLRNDGRYDVYYCDLPRPNIMPTIGYYAPYNPKITRFYRPEPAETDAQKIRRLSDDGFTVEYRTKEGEWHLTSVVDGRDRVWSEAYGYLSYPVTDKWSPTVTYLAHYREPEPEEVLRKMDELEWMTVCGIMGGNDTAHAQNCWDTLSDYYAIARWQLIESGPDNNVSL
jgi:hypothetical protein